MIADRAESVAIQPLVSWPRHAVTGRRYLVTVDARMPDSASWPYQEEEYEIGCRLSVGPACDVGVLGQSAVVLHRFGSTYGPAEFVLLAREATASAGLVLTLVNAWGIPVDRIPLEMSVTSVSEEPDDADVVPGATRTVYGEAPEAAPDLPEAEPEPPTFKLFINYRRIDSAAAAHLLHDRLSARFGVENVFVDTAQLEPGTDPLARIRDGLSANRVLIALIGEKWESSLDPRVVGREQDYVVEELAIALDPKSGVTVVPVLVDGAGIPARENLPRSIRTLLDVEFTALRYERFEEDVASLMDRLEELAGAPPRSGAALPAPDQPAPRVAAAPSDVDPTLGRISDGLARGDVVLFLGSLANSAGQRAGSDPQAGRPPDGEELAQALAAKFELEDHHPTLAAAAQEIYLRIGPADLYRYLSQLLADREPGELHRLIGQLPSELEALGRSRVYPMIVTVNYDDALEHALRLSAVAYDMVVYAASDREEGRFVHEPWNGRPVIVNRPNQYYGLPINDEGNLSRTVIVKTHGTIASPGSDERWSEALVITEDQQMDYLRGAVESTIPAQILAKLRTSHCLFLGHTYRDQRLRVLLRRIWRGSRNDSESWAVQDNVSRTEREAWMQMGVELVPADPAEYLGEIVRMMELRPEK